jgi:hypothetical protein
VASRARDLYVASERSNGPRSVAKTVAIGDVAFDLLFQEGVQVEARFPTRHQVKPVRPRHEAVRIAAANAAILGRSSVMIALARIVAFMLLVRFALDRRA